MDNFVDVHSLETGVELDSVFLQQHFAGFSDTDRNVLDLDHAGRAQEIPDLLMGLKRQWLAVGAADLSAVDQKVAPRRRTLQGFRRNVKPKTSVECGGLLPPFY